MTLNVGVILLGISLGRNCPKYAGGYVYGPRGKDTEIGEDRCLSNDECPFSRPNPPHFHTSLCASKYDENYLRGVSPLAIPILLGWDREIKNGKVRYLTPCRVILDTNKDIYEYIKTTGSGIPIYFFSLEPDINYYIDRKTLCQHLRLSDISDGKEWMRIEYINPYGRDGPPRITYVSTPTLGSIIATGNNVGQCNSKICCDCLDDCRDKSKCSCFQLTLSGIEAEEQNMGYENKRLESPVYKGIHECGGSCKCGPTCFNRVAQNKLNWPLQLIKTELKGWGVRTVSDLPKGTFICIYSGVIRTREEADELFEQDMNNFRYLYDLPTNAEHNKQPSNECESGLHDLGNKDKAINVPRKRRYGNRWTRRKRRQPNQEEYEEGDSGDFTMDACTEGNIGRYLNHSCDANLFAQKVFVDTHNPFPLIAFFAKKNIKSGTELTLNYDYRIGSVPGLDIPCYCGSPDCKGRII